MITKKIRCVRCGGKPTVGSFLLVKTECEEVHYCSMKCLEKDRKEVSDTPYPWCRGNPTKKDCVEVGYCRRDPNCGE
jgi:hypothetical protein